MGRRPYDHSVFINCPFDIPYKRIFDAIVFAVYDCGFLPRSALEAETQKIAMRLERIVEVIDNCRYGIHDLSRASIDKKTRLARFNMPLELGIFVGALLLGNNKQRTKTFVLLDREPHRYQKFISDLNGIDPKPHYNRVDDAIRIVRDWLRDVSGANYRIPTGGVIAARYHNFRKDLPYLARELNQEVMELTYPDYCCLIEDWLKENTAHGSLVDK